MTIFSIKKRDFAITIQFFGKSVLRINKPFYIKTTHYQKIYKIFGITVYKKGKKPNQKGSYGFASIIEQYAGVNCDNIQIQHGWTPLDTAINSDLEKDVKAMLCWNKRYKEDWDKKSDTPCYVIGAPFVHYRKMNSIKKNKDAKGTIAYPAHSIKRRQAEYDIDKYCQLLRELPEEFQPVTISLHSLDILSFGLDKEFEKRGFKTVCAFLDPSKSPAQGFYDILKNYKYATSNEPGSYTFYAVEMGIPFFLLGEPAVRDNADGGSKDNPAKILSVSDFKYGKIADNLFRGKDKDIITQEQKEFVESELGINDCLSKEEVREILKGLKK